MIGSLAFDRGKLRINIPVSDDLHLEVSAIEPIQAPWFTTKPDTFVSRNAIEHL
jgi:hypothetical protein